MNILSINYTDVKNQYKYQNISKTYYTKQQYNRSFRGMNSVEQFVPNNYKKLFSSEQIQTKVKELANQLNNFYNKQEVYVIPILSGAMYFASDLTKEMTMPVRISNVILSSYGNNDKSSGNVQIEYMKLPDLNNKNVLIVDDVVATGHTTKFLRDYINSHYKTKSTKICALFNEKVSRKIDFEPDFYGFTNKNFLIGYGLDDAGWSRNLQGVYYKDR